jgi:hypothetical protein
VKLPEAIQRQVEEAEALERQMTQPSQDIVGEEAVQEETPVVAEAAEHVEPETRNVEPDRRREDDADYWKQRFNTVQGMLNAQSAQFTEQLRAANERIQALASDLEKQKEAKTVPQVDDKDAETFGEDLTEAIDRRAKRMAESLVAEQTQSLLNHIQQLEAKLGSVNQQVEVSSQDRFYSRLEQLAPTYRETNQDQGFLTWLGEIDPVYGEPRQAALDAAAQKLDAERVAQIFKAYESLTGKQVAQEQKAQVRQDLQRQIAPTGTKAASNAAPTEQVWSLSEYEKAMDPRNIYTMGRLKADELALEAERALLEGRVR